MSSTTDRLPYRRTKIVATLGPSTVGVERLCALVEAGLDVARINFSHGTPSSHRAMVADLRKAAERCRRPIAVLADLSGPKIRVGSFPRGAIELTEGTEVELTTDAGEGSPTRLPHSYEPLPRDVEPGQPIYLDDGRLELAVVDVSGAHVRCRVVVGGLLRDGKGMNLPQTKLSAPALTAKDRRDLKLGLELGVDYLALSFVRDPEDLALVRRLANGVPVIAKIERPEAVERLEEILDRADGVMVARGDLGIEVGAERVPALQKRIIRESIRRAIPVITATQMLESMVESPRPTRAEVSDVANAVLDGTDAVMLSAETASGAHPLAAVATMARIIGDIEANADRADELSPPAVRTRTFSSAVAAASVEVTRTLGLSAIAVYSESGSSAADVSALRPAANIVAFSRHDRVLRQLALFWGVRPLYGAWVDGIEGVIEQAERELLAHGLARPGEDVVVTYCTLLDGEAFQTNSLRLWRMREAGAQRPERQPLAPESGPTSSFR